MRLKDQIKVQDTYRIKEENLSNSQFGNEISYEDFSDFQSYSQTQNTRKTTQRSKNDAVADYEFSSYDAGDEFSKSKTVTEDNMEFSSYGKSFADDYSMPATDPNKSSPEAGDITVGEFSSYGGEFVTEVTAQSGDKTDNFENYSADGFSSYSNFKASKNSKSVVKSKKDRIDTDFSSYGGYEFDT